MIGIARKLLFLFIFISGPTWGQNSTVWVTDQLQLGLHEASDTSGSAFRVLQSGTELEVLERNRFYARVRTTDGAVGWVKAGYLISNKPAAARVLELESSNVDLTEKLAAAESSLSTTNSELEQVSARADSLAAQANDKVSTLASLENENEEFRERLKAYKGSLPLSWVAMSLGLVLIAGFVGGLKWEDHQSRKRHGGIRVR